MADAPHKTQVSFSHVHLYSDRLKALAEYKKLEQKLNAFSKLVLPAGVDDTALTKGADIAAGRRAWLGLSGEYGDPVTGKAIPEEYKTTGQDVVEQMMVGMGWRITGMAKNADTCTLALTSPDPAGVKFLVTAHNELTMQDLGDQQASKRAKGGVSIPDHLALTQLARFAGNQVGRQGFAVLGFSTAVGGVDSIYKKYSELHPKLLMPDMPKTYDGVKVLEVFAYYKGEKGVSDADQGTVIRFVEGATANSNFSVLPGIDKVDAAFDDSTVPAYCDHWVSNVISRKGFLETLNETLGFSPKVDFNAGVVAAGEAQIESTVTGNDPDTVLIDENTALRDQSQVYLPTNNALSEVGHVHLYIKEIGQGIQHIASRVKDLPAFVQRANDTRKMTGAGVDFLGIPPSYYGSLTADSLSKDAKIQLTVAESYIAALKEAKIVDQGDIVDLHATHDCVKAALPAGIDKSIVDLVLRGRYRNLYALLKDHLTEDLYLRIVRNKILIDVQGDDLLMQIFTANVMCRENGQEAPFFEMIQRVCSEKKDPATGKRKPIKPGCGGFGIRNFLTLFLSIEVSKASKGRTEALAAGKQEMAAYYQSMVNAFTQQLDESNPVLTAISDAMTAEGEALERNDLAEVKRQATEKNKGQEKLMEISIKYKNIMKELREKAKV